MDVDIDHLGGWRHDPDEVGRARSPRMPRPLFAAGRPAPRAARAPGKTTLLYKAFKDVNGGSYIDYPAQTIGDCVSHGFGHGVDLLEAVQIALGHKTEAFKQTATEAIYGMARVDIGGERGSYSDGAVGAWAAKAVSTIGTVNRDVVGPYDGNRAKDWGANGVPADDQGQGRPSTRSRPPRSSRPTRSWRTPWPTATPSRSARTRGSPSSATTTASAGPRGTGATAC